MDTWTDVARTAIGKYGALHNEGELACLLAVLADTRPSRIVEIGTWAGGSAWAFGQLASVQHIVTIDPAPQPEAVRTLGAIKARVSIVTAGSQRPETFYNAARALEPAKADVLFIDGDHTYDAARKDWDTYLQLVRPGGLVVLHDTQGYPGVDLVQVPRLWAEIRQAYRTTELVDRPGGPGGTGLVWV